MAAGIAAFPYLLDVGRLFFVIPFIFLLRLSEFVGSVPKLLDAIVDFVELYLGRIAGRDDLGQRVFHGFLFADEAFHLAVELFADLLPVLVSIGFKIFVAVDEVHASLQFIFRRHEIFDLEGGDIVRLHADNMIGALLWRSRAHWQARPPTEPEWILETSYIGLERKPGGFGKELLAQNPVRLVEHVLFEVIGEGIFDNAAGLHVGQSESLGEVLQSAGFDDGFLENLATEVHRRTVRPDAAGADMHNIVASPDERNFHVAVFATFFGQNLNALEVIFVGSFPVVVAVDLAIQDDRRSAGSEGFARHLKFFRRDGRKALASANGYRAIIAGGQN